MRPISASSGTGREPAGLLGAGAGGGASLPPEQALFQPELRRSLQMYPKLALFVALLGVAFSLVHFFRLWPLYEARSLVYVQPMAPNVMVLNNPSRWPTDGSTYETFIQQKISDVTRPDVLAAALHKMQPGLWQKSGESDQAAAVRLSHVIQPSRSGPYQIAITVRASKPEVAVQLANVVTNAYLETAGRDYQASDVQRLAILREERDRVQDELKADRAEQVALSRQLGIAATASTAPDLLDDQIARTRNELLRVRTEHDEAAARFASMNTSAGGAAPALDAQADDVASTDAGLSSMKTSLNQRRATLISQMANLTPNHPLYKQDAAELDKINSALESSTHDLRVKVAARIQQKLRSDMQRTAEVEANLNAQLRSAVGAAAGATVKMQRSNDLSVDIARLQTRYANVDEQLHNLMLDLGAPGSLSLAAAAVPPLHPIRSGVFRNTFVLLCASILMGMLAAVLAHKMDARIYIASDVEQILGFAPMAQLPDFGEVSSEIAAHFLLRLAGDIDHICTQDKIRNLVLTGATAGVGVSTLAARLRPILKATDSAEGKAASQAEPAITLTEAAPVLVSVESEFLVRRSGWTIAVVESGGTTRSQLRALAASLQRLDVPAVGFVLNRVGMRDADPAFRRTIHEAERHFQRSGSAPSTHTLPVRQQDQAVAAQTEQLPVNSPELLSDTDSAQAEAGTQWFADAASVADRQPEPVPQERRPMTAPAAESAPAPQQVELPQTSRLDGLRGRIFQQGVRNISRAAESPVDSFPAQSRVPERKNSASAAPTKSADLRSAKKAAASSRHQVMAEPEILPPPREYIPVSDEMAGVGDDQDNRDRRDPYDEVNILPSWRGQYRKKG